MDAAAEVGEPEGRHAASKRADDRAEQHPKDSDVRPKRLRGEAWMQMRSIWTDGRKLPTDPQLPRYLGYSVGHWDGDTFIVETNGIDTRNWLSEDRRKRVHGFPHSADLKVEERYKRVNYGKLEATLTIIDPKIFTKPWVTNGIITLRPNNELSEYFCVPSEEQQFNNFSTLPSASGTSSKTFGPDSK